MVLCNHALDCAKGIHKGYIILCLPKVCSAADGLKLAIMTNLNELVPSAYGPRPSGRIQHRIRKDRAVCATTGHEKRHPRSSVVCCSAVLGNSPVNIAFAAIPGRGNKGGLSAYAERVGRAKQTVSELVNAARVAVKCPVDRTVLHDKTQDLSAIHALPESLWPMAVERMMAQGLQVRQNPLVN